LFELATETAFGLITLSEDLFAPVLQDCGIKRVELLTLDILEDATLRQMATGCLGAMLRPARILRRPECQLR